MNKTIFKNPRAILVSDLEQGSWTQDLVLCGSYNKGVAEIYKVKNELLYKNLEDLCISLKKQKQYLKTKTNQLQSIGRRKKNMEERKKKNQQKRKKKKDLLGGRRRGDPLNHISFFVSICFFSVYISSYFCLTKGLTFVSCWLTFVLYIHIV